MQVTCDLRIRFGTANAGRPVHRIIFARRRRATAHQAGSARQTDASAVVDELEEPAHAGERTKEGRHGDRTLTRLRLDDADRAFTLTAAQRLIAGHRHHLAAPRGGVLLTSPPDAAAG
ncbi:MAG: hypothetical protein M3Y06_07110 [Actinomycetota bacterium]|nr:hypothetical protein [Actinomycetota bacterium]